MSWKGFVAGYLTFSRKDRSGVLALLFLILLSAALPYFAPTQKEIPISLDAVTKQAIDSLEKESGKNVQPDNDYRSFAFEPAERNDNGTNGSLFYFDPNTLNDAGWRRLGLREKTIRTINKYRNKGGKFYRAEDLAKIWGLPQGFYDRVKGHIQIAQKEKAFANQSFAAGPATFVKSAPTIIDINSADTSTLIALPGIGSKLAARIVNFRNKLGGFISVEQVGETYGLPDSTFQKIRSRLVAGEKGLQSIDINSATKEILSKHPYINWKLANAIIAYREQHGPFENVEALKKIMVLDEGTFEKVKPYLAVQ